MREAVMTSYVMSDELRNDLQALADMFANARYEDVPTFAPRLYSEALELMRQASAEAGRGSDKQSVRARIDEATTTLGRAAKSAIAIKAVVSSVIQQRTASRRSRWERYHAAELLRDAENEWELALKAAEEGSIDEARKHATAAERAFQRAAVVALERGPLAELEAQLADARQHVPRARLVEAEQELGLLRKLLEQAGQQQVELPELRHQVAIARAAIAPLGGLGRLDILLDGGLDIVVDPGVVIDTPPAECEPKAPTWIRATQRTHDSLTLVWTNRAENAVANKLLRRTGHGAWEVVQAFGPLSGQTIHTDRGLQPETLYCYRLRTEGSSGTCTTPVKNQACGYTRDGNNLGVWRVQLYIRTADVSNARARNPVQARLNSPRGLNYLPNGNGTWLDYAPRLQGVLPGGHAVWSDEFDRGREFTYDLGLNTVHELSDITMVTLVKEGTDALGVAEVRLLVNGTSVFHQHFGETASTCLWLNDEPGRSNLYTVFLPELRAHLDWQSYVGSPVAPPLQIPNEEIVSRIESMVGDIIHSEKASWPRLFSHPVRAERLDDERLHATVRLRGEGPSWTLGLADPGIKLTFDLRASIWCDPQSGPATLTIATENFDSSVSFNILVSAIGAVFVNQFKKRISEEIEAAFQPVVQRFHIDSGGLCPTVRVDDEGNINFVVG
jgi:hypothetical protein